MWRNANGKACVSFNGYNKKQYKKKAHTKMCLTSSIDKKEQQQQQQKNKKKYIYIYCQTKLVANITVDPEVIIAHLSLRSTAHWSSSANGKTTKIVNVRNFKIYHVVDLGDSLRMFSKKSTELNSSQHTQSWLPL